jgi:RNA polymerase sigma-70 factor (sigma-E family)
MQRDLVIRAQHGDHDAFATLAASVAKRLDGTARLILHDPDDARDAVQEALIHAWRDLPGLRDPDRFDAWSYRLVVNACYTADRRRRHVDGGDVHALPDEAPAPGDPLAQVADRIEIEHAFRRLEPEQRAVLVCRHYLDLTVPEIAETLGLPEGTVKSRLSRALMAMRASLAAESRIPTSAAVGQTP